MKRLFNSLKFIFIASLLFVFIFFYFAVFNPLQRDLRASLEDNFTRLVSITEINVENYISRAKEGAESLSSRSMIRNSLLRYKRDEVSLAEVQEYTQPKYEDGVEVLDHCCAACRVSDGVVIANWSKPEVEGERQCKNLTELSSSTGIAIIDNMVVVSSPIIVNNNQVIGHDIVSFDMERLLNDIDSKKITYKIIAEETMLKAETEDGDKIIDYRQILDSDYWLQAEISSSQLYADVNSISLRILAGIVLSLLLVILVIRLVISKIYKQVIENLEEKIEVITKISERDNLVDTFNRTKFVDQLSQEISRAERYNNDLSLLMFDVDNFKQANDKYGHIYGDEILVKVSEIVKQEIRDSDFLARWGGDEFVIISPESSKDEAVEFAERLRKKISSHEFKSDLHISCSFGVAEYKTGDDQDSLTARADEALYKAKEKGRNRVEYVG